MATDEPVPYERPKSVSDEVRLLFMFFDEDKDGKVNPTELEKVLSSFGSAAWTKEMLTVVMAGSDSNGNGQFEFTEFWRWINGHGGKANELKETVLETAIAQDKERWEQNELKRIADAKKKAVEAEKEAMKAKKEAERAAGERIGKDQFIDRVVGVGVSRTVAANMFRQGDDDGDGEISKQELAWLTNDQVASIGQVKDIFKSGVDPDGASGSYDAAAMSEIVQTFKTWDADGDGSITCDELGRVLKTLNPKLGEKSWNMLMAEIDVNGDGFVDIHEFVAWLSGENTKKKKMKKKQKEQQDAQINLAMHKKRSAEARDENLQQQFEQLQHSRLPSAYARLKLDKGVCGTLNPGPGATRLCKECKGRHAWICHCCGFISYYDDCVNECPQGTFGWTCVLGECPKKKCGCKKKPDFWQRSGFCQVLGKISGSVKHMLDEAATTVAPEADEGGT